MNPLRIVHAASSYPLTPGDSTAPFMEEMLGALAGRGHTVSVVLPRVVGLTEDSRCGVEVFGAPYGPPRLQNWGYGRSLDGVAKLRPSAVALTPVAIASMARTLRRRIRRDLPDVVHLHWALPQGILASAIPRSLPIVVSLHGADARFFDGRLQPFVRYVLRRADALVAASSTILDEALQVWPDSRERAHVIPHGANAYLFGVESRESARRRVGVGTSSKLILAVGRLLPVKGFNYLLQALPSLQTGGTQLVVVGDGPQRRELEALAHTIPYDRIRFLGATGREELALWYAAADVVTIPSVPARGIADTGPIVLMEAMAAGRPVVATRVGMAPDVVRNGENGYLLDSADPAGLSVAIDKALAASHSLGIKARETFERIGDWNRVAKDLEAVYREAIERRRSIVAAKRFRGSGSSNPTT